MTGDTGAGKGYLAERWIEARSTELVIDPEGDHAGLAERPGVLLVDAALVHSGGGEPAAPGLAEPGTCLATWRPGSLPADSGTPST